MGLSVSFCGFWEGFDSEDFFLPIFRSVTGGEVSEVGLDVKPDVLVQSVFVHTGRSHPLVQVARNFGLSMGALFDNRKPRPPSGPIMLWFTGENVRPPEIGYSATLSFDSTAGGNFRVPLWWLLFPAPGSRNSISTESGRLGVGLSLSSAVNGRGTVPGGYRSKFACAFFGKPEPFRLRMLEALQEIGEVERFGSHFGQPVRHKFPVAKDFDFVVCPENSQYPGYVTEKAIEAWACGAIPLYAGNDYFGDLNPRAIVNASDFENLAEFRDAVQELRLDGDRMTTMRKENILSKAPDYSALIAFLRGIFK